MKVNLNSEFANIVTASVSVIPGTLGGLFLLSLLIILLQTALCYFCFSGVYISWNRCQGVQVTDDEVQEVRHVDLDVRV